MKKHPMKIIGVIFSGIAAVELLILMAILLFVDRSAEPLAPFIAGSVLGIQSLVFGSIGVGFLIYVHKGEARREELVRNGYFETGYVVETERVYNVRINNRYPYRVICRIQRDGVLHEYRSDMYRYDPGLQQGDPVRVYLDRQDEKRYYVDVESAAPTIIHHG